MREAIKELKRKATELLEYVEDLENGEAETADALSDIDYTAHSIQDICFDWQKAIEDKMEFEKEREEV